MGLDGQHYTYVNWHTIIENHSRHQPDKVFIESLDQNKSITFREMCEWCNRFANFLKDIGMTERDKVTLIGKNSIETMIIYFGTLKYGAILNPVFSEESEENIYRITNLAETDLILYDKDLKLNRNRRASARWLTFSEFYGNEAADDQLWESLNSRPMAFSGHLGDYGDTAEIVYTSGTTELPKGILIPRQALLYMVDEISDRTGIGEKDRVLEYRAYNWLSSQLLSILTSMFKGNTLYFAKKFSRTKFPGWLKKYDITVSSGVPAVLSMLVNEPVDLRKDDVPSLRFITSSSAPLPVETHLKFEEMYGIPINQMMGMSEAGWMVGNPPANRKVGSVGLPLKHKQVFFQNENGERCKAGEVGEMVVTGKSMGSCYLKENGSLDPFPAEGFITGDLGFMDAEGYIHITGRKKDLIIRGGINISPMEITSRVMEHPGVQEATTVGVPDPIYGEEVACFVVPKAQAAIDSEEIIGHCRKSLPDFKVPKKVVFLSSLPRNQRGKVAKNELLKLFEKGT
ncbi:MAG: putative sulfoacetate--CoA ligase [Syntrophorhabdus sp. PtaB.Bin047]|nr:MAG: putative sulfoacetate--CoA ligase [Syntrophorhabdus sp. PtaB.Bin047]